MYTPRNLTNLFFDSFFFDRNMFQSKFTHTHTHTNIHPNTNRIRFYFIHQCPQFKILNPLNRTVCYAERCGVNCRQQPFYHFPFHLVLLFESVCIGQIFTDILFDVSTSIWDFCSFPKNIMFFFCFPFFIAMSFMIFCFDCFSVSFIG